MDFCREEVLEELFLHFKMILEHAFMQTKG